MIMKLSQLFTKTLKDAPADEVAKNAELLIRAGYVHKEMAGVYAYLPLGIKVLENIKQIVREEMDAVGGQELIMTNLQRKELWEKTDRWDDKQVDVWFKTQLQNGTEMGLAWSHEEPITDMMRNHIKSYKDLPVFVYQFQTKLRAELRSKSGIMRGREFVMKDMYSYTDSEETHQKFYDETTEAYHRIFERIGIGDITYTTFASGGAFAEFSHEFQTICEAGEDIIYVDEKKKLAINEEVYNDKVIKDLKLDKTKMVKKKAAEVGNIFSFGGTKCEQLGLMFTDKEGKQQPVILGSYGIGITRLMGVIVELLSDGAGLVWPKSISPARLHIIRVGDDEEVVAEADTVYKKAKAAGHEVIYDDRDERMGRKLADADLMGIPTRVIISPQTVKKGRLEVKERTSDTVQLVSVSELLSEL